MSMTILCIVLAGTLLVACAGDQPALPTSTVAPTATTEPPTPTATFTPLPTTTNTPVPTPAQVAPPVTVLVEPEITLQTIREVGGGNFIHRFSGSSAPIDPVAMLNLETLNMRVARVRMDLESWEPVNDDGDPTSFNADAFRDTQFNHATLGLMRELAGRGFTLVASAWDVPGWMVENPDDERGRRLDPALYPEVIESIAAWLLRARDEYGAAVAYVSFNEADIGVNVALKPQEVQALIAQAGPRFAELGLETQWLLADAANMQQCLRYAEQIWAAPEVRPYLGPLACHSWDGLGVSERTLEGLSRYAQELDRELWVTESGWDPFLWQQWQEFPTWQNALNLAIVYSRALKSGGATVFLYWQMSGNDYNTNDGREPYPALDVLSQFARQFPAGSQVVQTSPNPLTLYTVAAQAPSHFVLHLINVNIRVTPVRVEGLPNGTYHHMASSEAGTLAPVQTIEVIGGKADVLLMPKSVNVLTTQAP
jgi:O-glycosyl hydrolase